MGQLGFWDDSKRLEKLSQLGDCLEKLQSIIDWQLFMPTIRRALEKPRKGPGGRRPFDPLMMFKILVLQRIYNLSDDQTEYQINDRISFMRFLGLGIEDKVPDAKTIWLFRDTLSEANVMKELFMLFEKQLERERLITHTGTIIDATIVEAPAQRNTKEEREKLKKGEIPEEWEKNEHKLRQKDREAGWTKKGIRYYHGYKDHVKVDKDSKLITDYRTTPASTHDSVPVPEMITEEDNALWADSAYSGSNVKDALPENVEDHICEKGNRNHPLTEEQKARNQERAKVRCRIEHVFGFMTMSLRGITLRSIGIKRAEFSNGLTNLIYNMFRYAYLRQPKSEGVFCA